jgi:hypothetical protein
MIAAVLAALTAPSAANAAGIGTFTFGAVPVSTAKSPSRAFFTFALQPNGSGRDRIVVSNSSSKPLTLALSVSLGTTAQGSGGAFITGRKRCSGAACWIHGLPDKVELGPHKQRVVPFTVRVPAGTLPRQYLAGITVQPTDIPEPTKVGGGRGLGANAIVIHQVNIGVAFTIGALTSMTTRLKIVKVAPVGVGSVARLLIDERNVGDTFLKATGEAICLAGKIRHAYPVSSDTVLPGNATTLAVNTPGLPSGANLKCHVRLNYFSANGSVSTPASWHGTVKIPRLVKPHVVQTGPGSYAEVPKARIPRWAIASMIGGGLIVLALVVVIVLLLRRRPPAAA